MTEMKSSAAFVRALDDVAVSRPTRVSYLRTFDKSMLLQTVVDMGAAVDNAPILTEAPTQVDRAYASSGGPAYFVPEALVPKRSKSNATPSVFIDQAK